MFRRLTADEIDCRISTVNQYGVSLLLFKDARVDMNILDETFGVLNWKRDHQLIDGQLFCTVYVWDQEKKEWISKQDVGVESYTEKEKGRASDSFKRACFNLGIGRELYTAPQMFVFKKDLKTLTESNGKWTCRDYFRVTGLEYDAKGNICYVRIRNEKTNSDIEFGAPAAAQAEMEAVRDQKIDSVKVKALLQKCEKDGVPARKILEAFKVASFEELTMKQYLHILDKWEKIREVTA